MVGFFGTTAPPALLDLIQRERVGGVILFARNVRDREQVYDLTQQLQGAARAAGHPHPLLIAIDQENGLVQRLGQLVTAFPGNMALGATDSEQLVTQVAEATGRELRALGINMNLAPVADVNTNPANPVIGTRAFGADAQAVARLVAAAVRGYRAAGIIATLKHFPGHGDTSLDSHLALPTVTHTRQRLEQVELTSFRSGIAAGAPCVLTAHLRVPSVAQTASEAALPATLAPSLIQGMLRDGLGFTGVVLTDCLEMRAIRDGIGTAQAAVLALQAGCDIALISHHEQAQRAALAALRAALADGRLDPRTLQQAASRVRILKAQMLSWATLPQRDGLAHLRSPAHLQLSELAHARAVTLARAEPGRMPLRLSASQRIVVLAPQRQTPSAVVDDATPQALALDLLATLLRQYTNALVMPYALPHVSGEARSQALDAARTADLVLIATTSTHSDPEQAALLAPVAGLGAPVVGLALGALYELLAARAIPTVLVAYDATPAAVMAAVRVLAGIAAASGRLPI